MATSEDPRMDDPLFANGYSSGVLASADLGTQVLIAQLQAVIDLQQQVLAEMQQTMGRLEEAAAVFREAELGSSYWKSHESDTFGEVEV
jgi:hypothetical protein